MINLSPLPQKTFHVLGYGVSGHSAAAALRLAGKQVTVWDDSADKRDQARVDEYEIASRITGEVLVVSPGIIVTGPKAHPLVREAFTNGTPITNDIGLFRQALPYKKIIGITGTNGKSTTTALIHHILTSAGINAVMGGNIGQAVLTLIDYADVYVLELSSYQLETAPYLKPEIGVLMNITPDHIDHHGSMKAYTDAKMRLFKGARMGIMAETLDYKKGRVEGYDLKTLSRLRGEHNWQNVAAAFAVCKAYGLSNEAIWTGVQSFAGLAHRQYHVRTIGKVEYINDSKATNADATQKALRSFSSIYLIAGGLAKEGGLNGLEKDMKAVKAVYLIGAAQNAFAQWLQSHKIKHFLCETIDVALSQAHHDAQKSHQHATVLLSPACASWDQFKNFEERGAMFEELVRAL